MTVQFWWHFIFGEILFMVTFQFCLLLYLFILLYFSLLIIFVSFMIFISFLIFVSFSFQSIGPLGRCCLSVCLSVRSLLMYRLTVFLPPFPEVRCQIFFEIRNPWGKVMERSGLTFEHFCLEVVENRRAKNIFVLLILPYKTWWKPCFQMD